MTNTDFLKSNEAGICNRCFEKKSRNSIGQFSKKLHCVS